MKAVATLCMLALCVAVLGCGSDDGGGGATSGSNSNACLADLGALQPVCPTAEEVSLPTEACCEAFRDFQADACGCSPFLDKVLGEDDRGSSRLSTLVAGLGLVCPRLGVDLPAIDCADPIAPSGINSGAGKTYNRGTCDHSDAEMDALRFQSTLDFRDLFATVGEDVCLDTPALVQGLAKVMTPDIELFVPYGIGTYKTYEGVAEYVGIAFAGLNHGLWFNDYVNVDITKPSLLEVSEDGTVMTQGSTFSGSFFHGLLTYDDAYVAQTASFKGCDTRISRFDILATEGMRDWAESFVQSADLFKRWGAEDICRYHTQYCAPDPAIKQYDSEQACLDFMSSLPLYSPMCGINRPLAGLSLPCKFKHHFMIPTNPKLHCPHIGPAGTQDPNQDLICDDLTDCSDRNETDGWPPIGNIGDDTPQAVIDLAAASNIGFEDEPRGCAIPTEP